MGVRLLAWVKPAVFGFKDAAGVTAAGVCFHLGGGFPASRVRFLGAEFGGIGVTVVKLASALDVVDDVEGAEKCGAHLSPFPASALRAAIRAISSLAPHGPSISASIASRSSVLSLGFSVAHLAHGNA